MHRTALFTLPLVVALSSAPAAYGTDTIPISREEIVDQADSDIARELSMSLEKQLGAGLIYIDWRIVDIAAGDEVPLTTESCHAAEADGISIADLGFSFPPYRNFSTWIAVGPIDPSRFTLNALECEPRPDEEGYVIRVRGLYFALAAWRGETLSYDLRPVQASIEVIQQLQEAGAFGP